jgi:hypothetical protein
MLQEVGKFIGATVMMPVRVKEIHQKTMEIDRSMQTLELKVEHWKTVIERCPNCMTLGGVKR